MVTEKNIICGNWKFDDCFRHHYHVLCYFAMRYLKDAAKAEDVVQDIFMKLLEINREFEDEESVVRFLYVATRNACLNRIKLDGIHSVVLQKARSEEESQEDEFFARVVRAEVYREIMAAIEELPRECSKVFRLAYVEGLDNENVAKYLGISVNTVKVQKNRAKIQLRERLKGLYPLLFLFFYEV